MPYFKANRHRTIARPNLSHSLHTICINSTYITVKYTSINDVDRIVKTMTVNFHIPIQSKTIRRFAPLTT